MHPPAHRNPRRRPALALIAIMLALALPARAHDAAKGPNGGPIATVENWHLELTTSDRELVVHVSDAKHEPIATAGATGRAIVQMDGKTATITLTPSAANRLTGQADTPIAAGTRVVVSATLAGAASLQARFVVP